jgi:hypothetical protein
MEIEFKVRMTTEEYNGISRVVRAEESGQAFSAHDAKIRNRFLTKCLVGAQLRKRRQQKRRAPREVQGSKD